ncbi:MAG TPA: alpha-amylase family glycosyl hydrolase [Candidatus Sulfotelmatobacter sp.]|nr:alpha-amylase family glycosyl hydrolase [Candidatus Sulfotelmatobacter sp.]
MFPKQPVIYQINAWAWLTYLESKHRSKFDLGSIPSSEWDALKDIHIDGVWFMGVWARSPAGRKISIENPDLNRNYRAILPDFSEADVSGSPYSIRSYDVEPRLGGRKALAIARQELASRGLSLLLDFVPNHVAPDHSWLTEHPNFFVQGDAESLRADSKAFFEVDGAIMARGRDPFFPPWPDTAQLNAFDPGLRSAAVATLNDIASQCDGVRCDMAMLMLNKVFAGTWASRVNSASTSEYWTDVINSVHKQHPGFAFIAEAYWDLEWELIQNGFDYCYDKRLYDRLVHDSAEAVHAHLLADIDYQLHMIRFLENHDEPRAAAVFPPYKNRAAAVALMTLPGAKLLHEGQMEGYRKHLSVHLGRRPVEPIDEELRTFYRKLLNLVRGIDLRRGTWRLCEQEGWPDNQSFHNIVSWCWESAGGRYLVAINLSDWNGQARIRTPWSDIRGQKLCFDDLLSGESYSPRDGTETVDQGLYVALAPWAFNLMSVEVVSWIS